MKKPLFWIVVFVVCTFAIISCQSVVRHRILLAEASSPESFRQVLPLIIKRGLLVLNANIANTNLEMLLDSGAFESKISSKQARLLDLEPVLSRSNSDTFGRSRNLDITRIEEIKLGGVEFRDISAGILTYPKSAYTPCVAPDGIIGGNLLKLTNWKLVYDNAEFTIQDINQPIEPPQNAVEIPMDLPSLSAVPEIDIVVNGQIIENVMVDLGFNGALILPVDSVPTDKEDRIYVDDGARSGIYGKTEGKSYLVDVELKIGSLPALKVNAEFTNHSGAKIGTMVLSKFLLVANNVDKLMYFSPSITFGKPTESTRKHGVLFGIAENGELWEVIYLEHKYGQPAPALHYGQKVRLIDGKTPGEQFSDHCDWFNGILDFLDKPQLHIETADGTKITL